MRFVCPCGVVDNTALAGYAAQRLRGEPARCTRCVAGLWHRRFPREHYDPARHGAMRADQTIIDHTPGEEAA